MSSNSQAGITTRVKGAALTAARQRRKLSQSQLARRIRMTCTTISMMESERCGASVETVGRIANELQVSTDFLLGKVEDPRPTGEIIYELRTKLARIHDLENGNGPMPVDDAAQAHIAIVEVDAAAGPGALVGYEHVIGDMKFPREWLRTQNLVAERCRLIRVVGESMEPTLPDSGLILVDLQRKERGDGKICVIRIGDDLIVKRTVEDRQAGWLLWSDNPDKRVWPSVPWPDDAEVVGQVRWVSRTLK